MLKLALTKGIEYTNYRSGCIIMMKQVKLFAILLTLIFSIVGSVNVTLFPSAVEATYVEGSITQDTTWTLVDSPFVLSKDVRIYSNATLAIEPGVEVHFGGDSSLTVEGRLVANGTKDEPIKFTSNKQQPEVGDWNTIHFTGAQQSSMLYCTVEYGTDGITVDNAALNIQNSTIRLNQENGIKITNGNVVIKNDDVTNNTGIGIYIAEGNTITVQNNTIESNGDGIALTGHLTSAINVDHNSIVGNAQSGILLEADAYDRTLILYNNLTANGFGFYVSTTTTTNITRNYISGNNVGILYNEGTAHIAHFNDISDNNEGMGVSLSATVDATYNFWGDRSGPYHESLNPRGKGNRVGGNGVNLDFIFFLTAPIDYANRQPTAVLWTDKSLVAPNQNVTFVGADSYDDGRVDQYFFDFGDGNNSGWTTLSLFTHSYASVGNYTAKLRVIDDFGVTSPEVSTTVRVGNLAPLITTVAVNRDTVNYAEQVIITAYVSNGIQAVENATVILFSVKGGSFVPQSGLTNSTGHFTATFTAPNVTDVTYVRIIAKANVSGYADGSDYEYLNVLPPLMVRITAQPTTVKSEATATIALHVTLGLDQPVPQANVTLSADSGNLSASIGVTDSNGDAVFSFTALYTLDPVNVTISASVTKAGYAGGQGQTMVFVEPRLLTVDVIAVPDSIVSEETSIITVEVSSDGAPVFGATVTVSSGSVGNFSSTTADTNLNGTALFVFTGPQTITALNATIDVSASKSGYISGAGQVLVSISPKVLAVEIAAEPVVTVSEAKVNVSIRVTYNAVPVHDATVTITSQDEGNFSQSTALTNGNGNVTFVFTAPQANAPHDVTIIAQASKLGYADGQNSFNITVNPGIISVQISTNSSVMSRDSAVVMIYATCNGTPVADARVTMSTNVGNFSGTTDTTDSEGRSTFIFNAPRTTTQLPVAIVANATKNGFIEGGNQTALTITPETIEETGGGWPLLTILLIVIPVVIAVVVFVLIRLKIIVISTEEET